MTSFHSGEPWLEAAERFTENNCLNSPWLEAAERFTQNKCLNSTVLVTVVIVLRNEITMYNHTLINLVKDFHRNINNKRQKA